MGIIQQENKTAKPFINLKTVEEYCRCCGTGNQNVCPRCEGLLNNGYAFFIEVKDSSTHERKKPTGFNIAVLASQLWENGNPSSVMQPGIYFIKESDLKQFLGNGYNKPASRGQNSSSKFLTGSPKWNNSNSRPTAGKHSPTELVHR